MFSVHNTQVLHITGRSRPPGEVGLTPRQYTEWNVVGRARATGGSSQQGLLPKVHRTACTRWYAHQSVQINNEPTTKNPRSCVRVVYIAGDTLRHQPMGASHMTMLQLCGPTGSCVLPWWLFIAVDTVSTSNGDWSHDCAPVMWAYGIPCPAMVSPNASQHKEDKLLYLDHYLVWYAKVDSGPHRA